MLKNIRNTLEWVFLRIGSITYSRKTLCKLTKVLPHKSLRTFKKNREILVNILKFAYIST